MKKIAIILLMLVFIGCDNRPPGAYDNGKFDRPIDVETVTVNGIDYLNFSLKESSAHDGWAVDYSQFFTKDTLVIDGWIWVRANKTEIETRKEQKLPRLEE